jgi:hypothetical protein
MIPNPENTTRMIVTSRCTTAAGTPWSIQYDDATDSYFIATQNGKRVASGFRNFADVQLLVFTRDVFIPELEKSRDKCGKIIHNENFENTIEYECDELLED